jgi:hypothetical protein
VPAGPVKMLVFQWGEKKKVRPSLRTFDTRQKHASMGVMCTWAASHLGVKSNCCAPRLNLNPPRRFAG